MLRAIQPEFQPRVANGYPMSQRQDAKQLAMQPSFKENKVTTYGLVVIGVCAIFRLCAGVWMLYSEHRWPFN